MLRVEPRTSHLQSKHSPTELHPLVYGQDCAQGSRMTPVVQLPPQPLGPGQLCAVATSKHCPHILGR